jgi:hypothetical protein
MKRKAQEEIYKETKDLSVEEEVEYFHKAGERFRREINALRNRNKPGNRKKGRKEATTK